MDAHGISKSLNLFLARSRSYGQTATKQTIPDSEDTFDSGGELIFSSRTPFSWNDTGFWNESIVCSLLRLHLVIVQTFPIFRIFFGCDRHAVTVYIHTTFYESVRQFSIKIIHFNHSCGKWDKLDIASSSVNLNSFFYCWDQCHHNQWHIQETEIENALKFQFGMLFERIENFSSLNMPSHDKSLSD